jgi:hypothetical protein
VSARHSDRCVGEEQREEQEQAGAGGWRCHG